MPTIQLRLQMATDESLSIQFAGIAQYLEKDMSHRNHASYDSVVKVTPQEAERNKRIMGKSEAAHEDPRGVDHTIGQLPVEEAEADSVDARKSGPEATTDGT